MKQRSSIFAQPATSAPLDLEDFSPLPSAPAKPSPQEIDVAHHGSRFKTREVSQSETVDKPSTIRKPMVYRTGRNVTFSVKTHPDTLAQFYDIARVKGWKATETFERAVLALQSILAEETNSQ